jgi:hypothetical protein
VNARTELVERIHSLPGSGVLAVTGGGAVLLADLLTVPGASATVLEARVPYAGNALAEFIGAAPDQACSVQTACDMAMAAFQRARALAPNEPQQRFGFGCTASLASTSPKRGEHRAHLAMQTLAETRTWSIVFAKGARDRATEERLLADIGLSALAETFVLQPNLPLDLRAGEEIDGDRAAAAVGWDDILLGRIDAVPVNRADTPKVLFPGAFNPLHDGHVAMARFAERHYGVPVAFEICANNVDKARLNYIALRHRVSQFDASTPVWVTNTATFVEKARCFPGVKFVVGVDTAKPHRRSEILWQRCRAPHLRRWRARIARLRIPGVRTNGEGPLYRACRHRAARRVARAVHRRARSRVPPRRFVHGTAQAGPRHHSALRELTRGLPDASATSPSTAATTSDPRATVPPSDTSRSSCSRSRRTRSAVPVRRTPGTVAGTCRAPPSRRETPSPWSGNPRRPVRRRRAVHSASTSRHASYSRRVSSSVNALPCLNGDIRARSSISSEYALPMPAKMCWSVSARFTV